MLLWKYYEIYSKFRGCIESLGDLKEVYEIYRKFRIVKGSSVDLQEV